MKNTRKIIKLTKREVSYINRTTANSIILSKIMPGGRVKVKMTVKTEKLVIYYHKGKDVSLDI